MPVELVTARYDLVIQHDQGKEGWETKYKKVCNPKITDQ
jgi:hypothetical protein